MTHRGRLVWAGVIVVSAALAVPFLWRSPEFAPGPVPSPVAPFGIVSRADLEFHWLVPHDEAPVAVEVLDEQLRPVWRSQPSLTGMLKPEQADVARLPAGDLHWRPVAVPQGAAERPGEAAAFTLRN